MKEKLFAVTLKDCEVKAYRGSGPGGQHRNKTDSAIRIVHKDSGAAGSSENHKSQLQNKKAAFKRMIQTDKFKMWMKLEVSRKMGTLRDIENRIDKEMTKIKIDTKDNNGRWIENKNI